jgi:general stress protein 26
MATRKPKVIGPKHVFKMLQKFGVLMVGTYEETGPQPKLRSRPMAVVHLDEDCTLTFATHIDTSKVAQALSPRRGQVSGQSRARFIAASGTFEVRHDPERVRQLWSKDLEVWFDGPDDPAIALMIFRPDEVELWDAAGAKGLKYAFEAARALVTGEKPSRDGDAEQHEVVLLH